MALGRQPDAGWRTRAVGGAVGCGRPRAAATVEVRPGLSLGQGSGHGAAGGLAERGDRGTLPGIRPAAGPSAIQTAEESVAGARPLFRPGPGSTGRLPIWIRIRPSPPRSQALRLMNYPRHSALSSSLAEAHKMVWPIPGRQVSPRDLPSPLPAHGLLCTPAPSQHSPAGAPAPRARAFACVPRNALAQPPPAALPGRAARLGRRRHLSSADPPPRPPPRIRTGC
jgi:hypothetical protein